MERETHQTEHTSVPHRHAEDIAGSNPSRNRTHPIVKLSVLRGLGENIRTLKSSKDEMPAWQSLTERNDIRLQGSVGNIIYEQSVA